MPVAGLGFTFVSCRKLSHDTCTTVALVKEPFLYEFIRQMPLQVALFYLNGCAAYKG